MSRKTGWAVSAAGATTTAGTSSSPAGPRAREPPGPDARHKLAHALGLRFRQSGREMAIDAIARRIEDALGDACHISLAASTERAA